jgi:NSS family neurotransmitter:Na+ symporter
MFLTMPKIFASMRGGRAIAIVFFVLVLFAALTSAIALTESCVSTMEDEFGWSRHSSTIILGVIIAGLGSLSCLGFNVLSFVKLLGMDFLDFFDFLTNSVMMPIAALAICILVTRCMTIKRVEQEVEVDGHPFRRKKIFRVMIRYIAPLFVAIILLSSIANAFGWISM